MVKEDRKGWEEVERGGERRGGGDGEKHMNWAEGERENRR